MESSDALLRSLTRRWPMILLAIVVAVGAAWAFTETRSDEYRSRTTLLVGPPTDGPVETLRAAGLVAHTYADVVLSDSNLRSAADAAGVSGTQEELEEMVEVAASETTRLVTVTVQYEDAEVAADFASALTQGIVDVAPVETPTLEASQQGFVMNTPSGMVTVVDDATVATEPVDRPSVLLIVLAGIVAAAVGGTAAVALEAAPWRRPPPNLNALTARRLLGRFPLTPGRLTALVRRGRGRQIAREQQLVTTKIQHLTAGQPLRSLSVFGAAADDGSPAVALDLARCFARDGRSVALVDLTTDGDLVHELKVGKRERSVQTVDDVVLELADLRTGGPGTVRVLVSDAVRATEDRPHARHVIDLLADLHDLVIVVAPPMLLEFSTLLVAGRTDGAVLVGSERATSIDGAIEAFDLLRSHDVPVLGTVLASSTTSVTYPSPSGSGESHAAPVGGPSPRTGRTLQR